MGQKKRGNAFELLTELLLQIDPVYRSKLKHVWHESNLPSGIRNRLGLPYPEIGVDLVAESNDGEYWAIQCKYHHDPSQNLSYDELKSFLDISTRVCKGKFSNLLAVCSAHGYSRNLQKHAPEVQYCLSDSFQSLDQDFFTQARQVLLNQTPNYKKRTPRPHQAAAVNNAIDHFIANGESRGKLIHPCGTGKSLIGYWIAQALKAKTVLVALPSLYLVRQTLTDWTKESLANGRPLDWMVVCSEDTITDLGKDDPSMRFQEIGVDVTTDVDRIATFLSKLGAAQKVIFTTYQSGYVTAKAARMANCIFDFGIFDEAHRTVGHRDGVFSHLIAEENIGIHKRMFMTATERRYQGSSDTILSMDDAECYGETFDLMTFKEALEQKEPILCDYKVVTMIVGKSEIQQLIDAKILVKPDKGKWDDDTEARTLAALIGMRKVMRDYKANHALTFHNSIAKAEAFRRSQERLNTVEGGFGQVDCYHVSSKLSTGERKTELDRFRDSTNALITNAKCLTEGVDVPTIDAVLFADPKFSTIDIVQAAGRALRPADGKEVGYIVVPVVVDEDDPQAADEAFQDVLIVLRAMASNDDRIIDYFRSVSRGNQTDKSAGMVEFVVSEAIKIRLESFVESIEHKAWHRLARLSWMPFEEARVFVRSLNLKNRTEWAMYCQGKMPNLQPRPNHIPVNPDGRYKNKGWISWGDWLGTGTIAHRDRTYRSFEDARMFARSLNLASVEEWFRYDRGPMPDLPPIPDDVPRNPAGVYKDKGWISWGDWLGTGRIANYDRVFQRFEDARVFARSLNLKNHTDWTMYCQGKMPNTQPKPNDIPVAPDGTYRDKGWISWGDWLGTGALSRWDYEFRPFADARAFVQSLGLKNVTDWQQYAKGQMPDLPLRPVDIPSTPARKYKNQGWISWGDWLGTGTIASSKLIYRKFQLAREFAQSLNLKTGESWDMFCRGRIPSLPPKPDDIPALPGQTYKDKGWMGWGDWLGTGTIAHQNRVFRKFEDARMFARYLNLASQEDWIRYGKGERPDLPPLPNDIPRQPWGTYKDEGWAGLGDWLGTGRIANFNRTFRSFEDARTFVRSLNLGNQKEWIQYCKGERPDLPPIPVDIPRVPERSYKNQGWAGLGDWLGKRKQ